MQLHFMTGCDANSGFYGKGKKLVNDQVAKNPMARRQLSWCGESLDLEEEVVEQFTRHVIYGDNKSSTIAEVRAAKWKRMNNKLFIGLPPDADSQRQHCLRANYLSYLMCHHGWELVGDRSRLVNTNLKWVSTLIFFTEQSLLVLFLYLFTYCINANSKNPHLPFSFKSYVFTLRDGGHL